MSKPAILICDDEEAVRETFKAILNDLYDITFAANGQEALRLVKSLSFNLMLLDIKMPKRHGMDVLKEIKQVRPALPVIIVTGYQSSEMVQEALKTGAVDYLTKPSRSQTILDLVAKHIR
jgi:DNA-binding NtrC family response regulator